MSSITIKQSKTVKRAKTDACFIVLSISYRLAVPRRAMKRPQFLPRHTETDGVIERLNALAKSLYCSDSGVRKKTAFLIS